MTRKIIINTFLVLIILCSVLIAGQYKGEKINLVFKDADLKNVLMLFAEYENKNFIIDERVKGKVTIRLKNVPWDQALKIILDSKDLAMIEDGNVIKVLPKKIVKEAEEEKIKAKERKKKLAPLITKIININFAKAAQVSTKIKGLLSKRGKVIVDDRTNSLIITDIAEGIKKAQKLINVLDRATPQVVIEAKIVVVKTSAAKEFGIQWGGSYVQRITSNNFFYGINGFSGGSGGISGPTSTIGSTGTTQEEISVPSSYIVNAPTNQPPIGGLGLIFGKWGFYNLSVKLAALKSKDLAKEISSPKVIALDNEKAVIEQGQEIPYKTVSDSGTKTEFKDAKLKLEVTPHITANKSILLDISLSKDSIGQQTTDGPAINTQKVTTKLLLKNGETAVIGGIIQNVDTKSQSSVPFFSDIPILGNLFKNDISSNDQFELLIFITPSIVERNVAVNSEELFTAKFPLIKKYLKEEREKKIKVNEKNSSPKIANEKISTNEVPQKKVNVSPIPIKQEKSSNVEIGKETKNSVPESNKVVSYPKGVVKAYILNLREKPSLDAKILSKIPKGDIVYIINTEKYPWYYVSYKNIKGWLYGKLLDVQK